MISEILKEMGISKTKAVVIVLGLIAVVASMYVAGVYLIVKVAKYAWG